MSNKQRSTALYNTPFSAAYWRDAAAEFKSPRMLVFAALMIALRVAMKGLYIPLGPTLRINTAFIINALGAMVFGPVVAIPAAIVSDFLGWLIFPNGAYFLPFVLTEVAGSLIFALFLYRAKVTPLRCLLSRFCIDLFVNILLTAPIMLLYHHMMTGKAYIMFQIPHMLKELFMFPVESVVLTLFLSVMIPITNRLGLTHTGIGVEGSQKLRFSKKEWGFMAVLFVVGAICVGAFMNYYYDTNSISGSYGAGERYDVNCSMTDAVVEKTDDWDDETLVTTVESAYKKIFGGYTTYNVAVYAVDEAALADYEKDLETIRGMSKSKAAAVADDGVMTRVATAVIRINDKTGEILSFELAG